MSYFEYTIPEDVGMYSGNIMDFLEQVEKIQYNMHSFLLMRHDKIVVEICRYPYQKDDKRLVYSASKTFTSTAVGIASDEGLLNVEDRVLDYFKEYDTPDLDPKAGQMKIRHLLIMSTGHGVDSIGDMCNGNDDWIRTFFTREMVYEPGGKFVYDSGATYMLSEIVSRVTGKPMVEFIRDRFLVPLEIQDFLWETHGNVNTGAWGVMIKPEDLAKLGIMYLHKGMFGGKRILSEQWVEEATSPILPTGRVQFAGWSKEYGYQIWRSNSNSYRANGAFGQFCMVFPEEDMVIAATSEEADASRLFPLIEKHLLANLSPSAYRRDTCVTEQLIQMEKGWEMPLCTAPTTSYLEALLPERQYRLQEETSGGKHLLQFSFETSHLTFSVDNKQKIESSNLTYQNGETHYVIMPPTCSPIIGTEQKNRKWIYSAHHQWVNEGTLLVTVCYREAGHEQQWLFSFTEDRLRLVVSNSCKKLFGLFPDAKSDRNKDFGDMVFCGKAI